MREEIEAHLVDRLEEVEGKVPTVYKDSKGLWTIGIGILVDPKVPGAGLTYEEMRYLARNRIRAAEDELDAAFPWFAGVDEPRRAVFVELVFNMGMGNRKKGLRSFVNTLRAAAEGRWLDVGAGLRRSKWYRDVKPRRADPLIRQVETGQWQY